MSEKTVEKVFVVVDPSKTRHYALERAIQTAKMVKSETFVHAFVAVDPDAVDTRATNDTLFRDLDWFSQAVKQPLEDAGIPYDLEVSWSSEWQQSIISSSKMSGAGRIYLPVHERSSSSRFSFSESKWDLLKAASMPVVLIQPEAAQERKVVLAAVNFQALEDFQRELNQRILSCGKKFAEAYDAEIHVVNAYLDSMNYPDRGQLAKQTGLPPERIHVEAGYTSEAVSAVAKRVNADLVVMGTLGQNGMTRTRRRGNTAERVIAALTQDIMVINSN